MFPERHRVHQPRGESSARRSSSPRSSPRSPGSWRASACRGDLKDPRRAFPVRHPRRHRRRVRRLPGIPDLARAQLLERVPRSRTADAVFTIAAVPADDLRGRLGRDALERARQRAHRAAHAPGARHGRARASSSSARATARTNEPRAGTHPHLRAGAGRHHARQPRRDRARPDDVLPRDLRR